MYIQRNIDAELLFWKKDPERKPLLLRGARQVGKTKTIREFGRQFDNFLEVNFDENKSVAALFKKNLDPAGICENLAAIYKTEIVPGKTLVFFDEIQTCPEAIASLRYFYERLPGLHLIGAGSLLEFALEELPAFGVGRIRSLFIFPLSFAEFLGGLGEKLLIELLKTNKPNVPLSEPVHTLLLQHLRKFIVLGGMPEVIASYIQHKNLNKCNALLDDLMISYRDDFVKYKKKYSASMLNEVFFSVINLAGQKYVFTKSGVEARSAQIKEGLRLLLTAGLIIPVIHTSANGLPLRAEADERKQKYLLLDTGLFQRLMGLDLSEYIINEEFQAINKGFLAEQFVGLELLKNSSPYVPPELFYWHRESKSSNAEVDYIVTSGNRIFPVEVKSSGKGQMKSIYQFLTHKNSSIGIRLSTENFSAFSGISVIPLYATGFLKEYLKCL